MRLAEPVPGPEQREAGFEGAMQRVEDLALLAPSEL
jgi:hypothetical protein